MKSNKIIITVRGGNVHSVHACPSLPTLEIVVLDYDNLEAGDTITEDQKVAEGEIKHNQVIEVY